MLFIKNRRIFYEIFSSTCLVSSDFTIAATPKKLRAKVII